MAGQGTGPSRRSHTKSRKGCKTCKRRHIRCDETFPQCRNCTKHQVRCDYMETVGADAEGQSSPEQPSLVFTPGTESRIDLWQQTGSFPYPNLQVFPPPQTHEYSKNELRLIHHISSISNDLVVKGTTNLTIWTQKVSKFLSIAASYPYVMHALLSFSANHLAWSRSSDETRNLHIHHGTIALRGLHEAIGSFSHANADAVLAASLLLLWQATDWRSWSSLRAGIQSVLATMHTWKHESIFAEYINEEDLLAGSYIPNRQMTCPESVERYSILTNAVQSLQQLQRALMGHEGESYWIGQLLDYIQRLQASSPAQSPDEQFSHLYLLRKWLFWVPVLLLERQGGQGPAMLTLSHFYAVALALEPLYPDLGSAFCARLALAPLETIITVTEAMQSQRVMDQNTMEIASLMRFPQQMAMNFRSKMMEMQQAGMASDPTLLHLSPETLSYTSIGNLSPAFAPSPLHSQGGQLASSQSSYLEVPTTQSGFTYGTQSWGAMPSPGFPPLASQDDQLYGGYSLGGFRGGFVTPAPVWT
ncbi:related to UPC2 Regulatory involved in control of sterol uptake [Lecanosticta acicola]|uniref:Related to UPC2 Regulatory involved in control of sterol uptake n=1 Tax=Lecanosticta acicola TaxID=111012 RepID=A0AAI8Z0I5_9PEZI|nr:related to UPC2 Regulatory involved in control of sterol uptake [Lecanosticta acicola]